MALGLKKECKDRLIKAVAEKLSKMRVEKNIFLDYKSIIDLDTLDRILPESGKIRDKLNKYVCDAPLSTFIYETISMELYENYEYEPQARNTALTSFPYYSDAQKTAERLVAEFENLPFQYLISFGIPATISDEVKHYIRGVFQLDDMIKIVIPDENFDQEYPLSSGIAQCDKDLFSSYWLFDPRGKYKPEKWSQNAVYLQFNVEGFIGIYLWTIHILRVINAIKSFFGLGLVVDAIKSEKPILLRPRVSHLIVHGKKNGKWEILHTHRLPMELAEFFEGLKINTKEQIKVWLDFGSFIYQNQNYENKERLLLANQWLLDSYIGDNELMAFVQAMIAMEVLLGGDESKETSLTELICNRCAYFVGETHEEIKSIMKELRDIYKIRSGIVHRGKPILTIEEREKLHKLRNLCRKVIFKEIWLILEHQKKSLKG